MKKLIAISVLFALLAVGAFAQISGGFRTQWMVVESAPGEDALTYLSITDATFKLSGQNEEGTIGAQLTLNGLDCTTLNWGSDDLNLLFGKIYESYAWWQPIPQVKLYLGNYGGLWGFDGIVGWGFHEGNADYGHVNGYAYGAGGGGGFGYHTNGFGLEINPIDGLQIDFGLPLGDYEKIADKVLLEDAFKGIYVQANYEIGGIGKATIDFKASPADGAIGVFGLGFSLSAIENVPIVLLVNFDLKEESDANKVGLSIAAGFSSGDFGVRFRAASSFEKDGDFNLKAQIMPFYDVGIFKFFLNIGLDVNGDDPVKFYLNPYITKDIGPGKIALGIDVQMCDGDTVFKLPITIGYNF